MYKIICCMKSKESYIRIVSHINQSNIDFEENMSDLDNVQEKVYYTKYDLAIVDEKIWWKNEALEFFNKQNIEILLFQGDFEEIINKIKERFVDNEVDAEPINDSDEEAFKGEKKAIKYVPLKEIEYVDREVKVEVYKPVYAGIKYQVVLVANLTKRAGSTFLTLNLAKALSNYSVLTSVIEPPIDKPYIFDTIDLEKRLEKKSNNHSLNFYSYPHVIVNNEIIERNKETIDDGIVWLIPDPRRPLIDSDKWDFYCMMKLLYASKLAPISIIDCGFNIEHESIKPLMSEADLILIVIDPLPTECMQNNELLDNLISLKADGLPIEFVVNRWNKGVNKIDFLNYIKVTPFMQIPAFNSDIIYKAIYEYKFPIDYKEIEDVLLPCFSPLIRRLLPKQLIKEIPSLDSSSMKKNILKKFFGGRNIE